MCVCSGISSAAAACLEEAAAKYGQPVGLLRAIAKVESEFNPRAVNRNTNGSEDIGLMQINSVHLPKLGAYGITRDGLLDACTNSHVGAFFVADAVRRLGWNWTAVGAFHSATGRLRRRYAQKIWQAWHKEEGVAMTRRHFNAQFAKKLWPRRRFNPKHFCGSCSYGCACYACRYA